MSFSSIHLQYAVDQGWISQLVSFVKTSLEGTKSNVFLQNIDFSVLFIFLKQNITVITPEQQKMLCDLAGPAFQGLNHANAYSELVQFCATNGIIDLAEFIDNLLSTIRDPSSPHVLSLFLQLSTTEDIAMKFLNCPRVSKEALCTQFMKEGVQEFASPTIREKLLTFPKLLFSLITCDSPKAINKMERIMVLLFRGVSSLSGYHRAESAVTRTKVMQIESFFTWKDSPTSKPATGETIPIMHRIFYSFLESLKEVNDRPTQFFAGSNANYRFTALLRVIHWMLLRSKPILTDDSVNIILQFFDTIATVNLANDCNLVELLRIVQNLNSNYRTC